MNQESKPKISAMQRTETAWDEKKYMDILKSAIINANSVNRSGDKPMAALWDKFDSHLTYRLVHELNAASVIKRLAEGIGLNGELAYVGMMMHDVGHPFSAHDGEEIFTSLGKINNCGYFHHNAKGIEIIQAENILNTALSMIPNIDNLPELKEKLEMDFNYFLDIVISHDGEAKPGEENKQPEHYDTIKEAVEDKLERSNTKNDYKFTSQIPEGMLGKYADVIAYLSSDIRDGFRLGILKTFNDKYLELFGAIISENYLDIENSEEDRIEAIKIAKNKLASIQEKYLEETSEDVFADSNKETLDITRSIMKEIKEKDIDTFKLSKYCEDEARSEEIDKADAEPEEIARLREEYEQQYETEKNAIEDEVNKIMHEHMERYIQEQGEITDEKYAKLDSDIQKISSYVRNMLYINTRVVNHVTNIVQEYFINDLIRNTKSYNQSEHSDEFRAPMFSDTAKKLYKRARNFGYTYYVPNTKTEYQKHLLPQNVERIVNHCSEELMKSKIIQQKLKNSTVREKIPAEYLEFADSEIEQNSEKNETPEENKRKLLDHARSLSTVGHYTRDMRNRKSKFDIIKKIEKNVQGQTSRFARTYVYTCKALETQVRSKIKRALSPDYKYGEEKGVKKTEELEKTIEDEIKKIRETVLSQNPELAAKPSNKEEETERKEKIESIIKQKIQEERKTILEKMATQLSIDYVSGMTDEGIKDLAIELGYMTQEQYEAAQQNRGGEVSANLKGLQAMTR